MQNNNLALIDAEWQMLLKAARLSIHEKLQFNNKATDIKDKFKDQITDTLNEDKGVFVTLKKHGNLRGCIGTIIPIGSIIDSVIRNARSSAFNDYRFPRVRIEEVAELEIEISVLTTPETVTIENIRPKVDGVILKSGSQQATFLPQVWEQLSEKNSFLNHLCNKAGLPGNFWKTDPEKIDIETYQVAARSEQDYN